MLARLARLRARTAAVYRETGSGRAAGAYAGKLILAKAALFAGHLRALGRRAMPWHAAAEVRRLDYLRRNGDMVIAITVSGGIGDLIVYARFMRDLAAEAGPFVFDVFASRPLIAEWVFGAVPGFASAFPDSLEPFAARAYDLELRVNQGLSLSGEATNWARLRQAPRMLSVLDAIQHSALAKDMALYLKYHPRLDNGMARKAVLAGRQRNDFLHSLAAIPYGGPAFTIAADESALARFGLQGRDFITVHNGFDTNFIIRGQRATKCYPHFDRVIATMKAARPGLLIVQLGTTTSEPIPDVDLNLIGQTNLQQAAALMRATLLHLDNEGGLVHLAACYGRRSLVVFGPTPSDYFGYTENINVNPVKCGDCWWLDDLWMDRCPRGLPEPECMFSQPPEQIAHLALDAITTSAPAWHSAAMAAPAIQKA